MIRYLAVLRLIVIAFVASMSATPAYGANPGEPLSPVFTVMAASSSVQEFKTAPLPGSGTLVVWKIGDQFKARAFDADGTPRTPEIVVRPIAGPVRDISVASNTQGEFVIAWIWGDISVGQLEFRKFNAAGVPLTTSARIVATFMERGTAFSDSAVGLSDSGDVALVWRETAERTLGCGPLNLLVCPHKQVFTKLARYTGGGLSFQPLQDIEVSGLFPLNVPLLGVINLGALEEAPSLSMAPDGRFVVAWWRNASAPSLLPLSGVYVRQFHMDGRAEPARWVSTEGAEGGAPSVSMDVTGAFVVAYERNQRSLLATAPKKTSVFVRDYSPSGQASAERVVNTYATPHPGTSQPMVAVDATGNYVVLWRTNGSSGLMAQRFARGGSALAPAVNLDQLNGTSGGIVAHALARDPTGSYSVAWVERVPFVGHDTIKVRSFAGP